MKIILTMRHGFTAAALWICVLAIICCSTAAYASAADTAPHETYVIRVSGPSQVHTGDEIHIVISGCGSASHGAVVVAGLQIMSVSGGYSTAPEYLCMADFGGLKAEYTCTVTAPAGSTCAFGLVSPRVSDPRSQRDVDAACQGWSCAVRAQAPPSEAAPASDPSAAPAPERPVPATLSDALADTTVELRGRTWNDISADYLYIPYEIVAGNAYLAQMTSWRDYSDFMFDSDFVIVPFDADGAPIPLDDQSSVVQATGQHIFVTDRATGTPVALQDVVMQGDVTGQGALGISQLVRMADAVTKRRPLVGLYKQAGDVNNNGRVDIGDLTCIAAWVRGHFLDLPV